MVMMTTTCLSCGAFSDHQRSPDHQHLTNTAYQQNSSVRDLSSGFVTTFISDLPDINVLTTMVTFVAGMRFLFSIATFCVSAVPERAG